MPGPQKQKGHEMTRRSTQIRRRGGILALLGLSALTAWTTGTASAYETPGARFVWESCDPALPGGNPPPEPWWHANPGVAVQYFNHCSQPEGSLGIQETGPTSETAAWLEA